MPPVGSTMETYYPAEANAAGVSWAAIFSGAFITASLWLVLTILGVGLGLFAFSPWTGQGASAKAIGVGAVIWLFVSQIIACGLGGYLAGRLRTKWVSLHTNEVYFRDTAHGFMVWAVAVVFSGAFIVMILAAAVAGNLQMTTMAAADPPSPSSPGPTPPTGMLTPGGTTTMPGMPGAYSSTPGAAGPSMPGTSTSTPGNMGMMQGYGPGTSSSGGAGNYYQGGTSGMNTRPGGTQSTQPGMTAYPGSGTYTPGGVSTYYPTGTGSTTATPGGTMTTPGGGRSAPGGVNPSSPGTMPAPGSGGGQPQQYIVVSPYQAQGPAPGQPNTGQDLGKAGRAAATTALWIFVALLVGAFCASIAATLGGRQRDNVEFPEVERVVQPTGMNQPLETSAV
jgi:hypothetical protein